MLGFLDILYTYDTLEDVKVAVMNYYVSSAMEVRNVAKFSSFVSRAAGYECKSFCLSFGIKEKKNITRV